MTFRARVSRLAQLGLVAGIGFVASVPSDADACGGCFIPPGPPTVVTGHRMVMSISMDQTVLWDQIQYSGDPEDFAWVLPVKPGARIEASTSAFFEVLEATTATRVNPVPISCGGGSSGAGCGAVALSAGEDFGGESGDPVEVVHQGTVGPYETVTLSTDEPGALNAWLDQHGYNVDDGSQPIIDGYVAEGFDFIAIRLQPGQGISEMTPVRVVMDGSNFTLPLRMVAIGTGAVTPIVLYVIGEGRYTTQQLSEVSIDEQLLSWDFKDSSSNYTTLREGALAKNDGLSVLPTFASPALFTQYGYFDPATFSTVSIPQLYATQAYDNQEISSVCSIQAPSQGRVRNPCPPGEPWDSPACGSVGDGEVDARVLGCPGADDIAVALNGMSIDSAWVTRLEMSLPRTALAEDLTLEASTSQLQISSLRQANIAVNEADACGGLTPVSVGGRSRPGNDGYRAFAWVTLAGAALALAARKLRVRKLATR